MFKTFEIWNFGHAQRRRLRRVLGLIWNLVLVICDLTSFILVDFSKLYRGNDNNINLDVEQSHQFSD